MTAPENRYRLPADTLRRDLNAVSTRWWCVSYEHYEEGPKRWCRAPRVVRWESESEDSSHGGVDPVLGPEWLPDEVHLRLVHALHRTGRSLC